LTKEQRKKYQRAQIQLGAAGIQVPTRHISQLTTSNNDESIKKRILYDDHRKTSTTDIFFNLFLIIPIIFRIKYFSTNSDDINGIRGPSAD